MDILFQPMDFPPYTSEQILSLIHIYIPDPQRATDKPFLMPVEDVFTITGRGTVATGRVERGVLHLNDEVEIVGAVSYTHLLRKI